MTGLTELEVVTPHRPFLPSEGLGWHIDPRDKDPRGEEARVVAFRRDAHIVCPGVDIIAVPNAARRTRWEVGKAHREGMKAGALDLVLTWKPTRPDDRGVAFMEFKNGTDAPDANQRDRLNMYVRQGHRCGVFRQEASALRWLRWIGAPFIVSGAA